MISVEEALERMLTEISPLSTIRVQLSESLGHILAEDVISQEDIPPFANSAMDGFALLSQDSLPQDGQSPRLRVTGGKRGRICSRPRRRTWHSYAYYDRCACSTRR